MYDILIPFQKTHCFSLRISSFIQFSCLTCSCCLYSKWCILTFCMQWLRSMERKWVAHSIDCHVLCVLVVMYCVWLLVCSCPFWYICIVFSCFHWFAVLSGGYQFCPPYFYVFTFVCFGYCVYLQLALGPLSSAVGGTSSWNHN